MAKPRIRNCFLAFMLLAGPAWSADTVTPKELGRQLDAGEAPLILDVRTEAEYLDGHVPGARLIPHDRIGEYMDSLSQHRQDPVVVYCHSGGRTEKAIRELEQAGFSRVIELEGSFQAWKRSEQPVEVP